VNSTFLTKYGLHHFVAFSNSNGDSVFSIAGSQDPKMIDHARYVIEENFPGNPVIVLI
jgi:hypothetical protein